MKCACQSNMSTFEGAVRVFVGFLLMALGIYMNSGILVAVSFIPLITGVARKCPIYKIFKLSACQLPEPKKAADKKHAKK